MGWIDRIMRTRSPFLQMCQNLGGFRIWRKKNVNRGFPAERNFDGSIRAILSNFATNLITFGIRATECENELSKHLAFASSSFELISILIHFSRRSGDKKERKGPELTDGRTSENERERDFFHSHRHFCGPLIGEFVPQQFRFLS